MFLTLSLLELSNKLEGFWADTSQESCPNLFFQFLGDDVVKLEADLLLVAAGARQDVVSKLAEIEAHKNMSHEI